MAVLHRSRKELIKIKRLASVPPPQAMPATNVTCTVNMSITKITLLNQTLDSLDLRLFSQSSFSFEFSSQLNAWRNFKENYDFANPKPYFENFNGLGTFELLPRGHSPYEFTFVNEEIGQIYLMNPDKFSTKFAINTGQFYINFRSKYLQCQSDDYGLVNQFVENLFSNFYDKLRNTWVKVSRSDLACDVGGAKFNWQDLTQLCARSRKKDGLSSFCTLQDLEEVRGVLSRLAPQNDNKGGCNRTSDKIHLEGVELTTKQLGILLELTNRAIDDPSMSRAIFGQDLQTAYIGRFGSKIYARIYLKSQEIKNSGKEYLTKFWQEKGWQEDDQVWRAEFSLSGDFLKEFHAGDDLNLHHWQDFQNHLDKLWTYCTSDWLRHTTSENSTNSRSPNSEFWDCVSSAFAKDQNFCRLPLPAPPSETLAMQILAQAKGCLKSFAALIIGGFQSAYAQGEKDWNQKEYLELLINSVSQELHAEISIDDISERRSHYGCDEFSDTQFSAAIRAQRIRLGRGS